MGVAEFESDVRFDHQRLFIAAIVGRTDHGNLHSGVLYIGANDERLALHLGWQDQLSQRWDFRFVWATPDAEPELLSLAAGYCRLIWASYQQTRSFPYALEDRGASFDENGRLVLADGAHGLTCATIVLAIFNRAGIELVDRETWPVRKDLDLKFLEMVAEFAEPEHLKLLRAEVEAGARRVHPDEVVASCACALPATFDNTRAAADALLVKLDAPAP